MSEPILVLVDDLIFQSKIREAARQVGVSIETTIPAEVKGRLEQSPVRGALIDLNHRSGSALEVVRTLKTGTCPGVPVIGFVSHVQSKLIEAARAAGCDAILARSAFVRDLPEILKKLAGEDVPA